MTAPIAASPPARGRSLGFWLESVVYAMAGLPLALGWSRPPPGTDKQAIRATWLRRFRHPHGLNETSALIAGILLLPILLPAMVIGLTLRNGPAIRRLAGIGRRHQALQQLRLFVREGMLPPWYYIFELHDPAHAADAGRYVTRFETKRGVYPALRRTGPVSPLRDKARFADHCRARSIRCTPTLCEVRGGRLIGAETLPEESFFVKPAAGRGGTGTERFELVAPGRYRNAHGHDFDAAALRRHLEHRSHTTALVVQPRLVNHPALADLSCGALSTVRALSCLDEGGEPVVTHAVFRMAIRPGAVVDNFHAGGIAAAVDLADGALGSATDLGLIARTGWVDAHPRTGAAIVGRRLPFWPETLALAADAHRVFGDHAIIGWDIAILADGPCIVEGNGGPDVDLIQRPHRAPLGGTRFAEICAWRLARAQCVEAAPDEHRTVRLS